MRRISLLTALVALLAPPFTPQLLGQNNASAPAQAPGPNTNVEVLDLGPAPTTGGFASIFMSADYRHIGIAGPSGSRAAAFIDGQAGDKYDQIQTTPPVLSADGKRWAYVARKGTQLVMIVDGKEYGPYDRFPALVRSVPGNRPLPYQATPIWPIVFSPDTKHVAFLAQKGNQSVVVEDGKEIASGQIQSHLLFSKQGNHLAFVVRDATAMWVVLDGMPGPKYQSIQQPQFSADGRHLFYAASRVVSGVPPRTQSKYMLVADGVEGPMFDGNGGDGILSSTLLISSDGAHTAYAIPASGPQGDAFVVIDGKQIPNAFRVWMTPDGKNVVYLTAPKGSGGSRNVTMVVNGKPGLEYGGLKDLRFAPDGRPIYSVAASQTGKTFVVDGTQESGPFDDAELSTLKFSADGRHYAYVARGNDRWFVVLDGKKMRDFFGIQTPAAYDSQLAAEKRLQMTPDGHVVYYASDVGVFSLVKDDQILGDGGAVSPDGRRAATVKLTNQGSSTARAQLTLDGQAGPVFSTITKMVFSPDSKHFAYVGTGTTPIPNGSGKEGGYFLVVDGVQKGEYPEVWDLQYSPDSQHLFHFTMSHLYGGPTRAYMNQQLYFTFLWLPGYDNRWLDDGRTMQTLGGKYDAVTFRAADPNFYRVRYFLPGANRNQASAVSPGTGTVDLQETRRMLGAGAASAAAVVAAPAGAQPAASAPGAPAPAVASAAPAAPDVPPAGTAVEVRLVDAVNSSRDQAGRQYRATVTGAVNAGNTVTIAQGAAATVTLARNASGWTAQLSSLVINGKVVPVTSSSASVTSAPQNAAAAAVGAVLGGVLGRRGNPLPAPAAVATGQQVVLPPGVTLSFVLGAPSP